MRLNFPPLQFCLVALLFTIFVSFFTSCRKFGDLAPVTGFKDSVKTTTANPVTVNASPDSSATFFYTAGNVINLNGAHDLVISGQLIAGGTLPCITLTNCYNIHITKCKLFNSTDVGIHLYNCKNITIDYNYFTNVSSGTYAEQSNGGGIAVNYNQFL